MKDFPQRQPIRLTNFDYGSNGAYFITICVKDRKELLAKIDVGAAIGRPPEIKLSDHGNTVNDSIQNINMVYQNVSVDKYVIMPNHIHLILIIEDDDEPINNGRAMRAPTVGTVINQLKGYASKQIGFSLWQKSFYDHIIRDEEDYQTHLRYIAENPAKWAEDEYYGGGF